MGIPSPNSSFALEAASPRQSKRRKGSRAQLATRFFSDLYAAWEEQGEAVLARAAFHDPVAFMRTVASLMPQKIEVSTPVDGMSDERLAELLDYAERMAALKAVGQGEDPRSVVIEQGAQPLPALAHRPADENGLCDDSARQGGGGPDRVMAPRGEDTPSTLRAVSDASPEAEHNPLNRPDSNDATTFEPPYPVGRPSPLSDVEAARLNRAKLVSAADPETAVHRDYVDPASLF